MAIDVQIDVSYDLSDLERHWRDLEPRSTASFFLTWKWIGAWLQISRLKPLRLCARQSGEIIALGLVVPVTKRRHMIPVRQLYLHQTGEREFDRIEIEHNGFLIRQQAPANTLRALLTALQESPSVEAWDELVLSGVSLEYLLQAEEAGLVVEIDRASPEFCVALEPTGLGQTGWLQQKSSNLRSQIRQAHAFAGQFGAVQLSKAKVPEEAVCYFEDMVKLHTEYWNARGLPGAFQSPFALAFHRELLQASIGEGQVQMLRLSAGPTSLGYLYNFVTRDVVSSYQSGFARSRDNRDRPGLLAHSLAIHKAHEEGFRKYDFLAGENSLKRRLSTQTTTLYWCRAQRPRAKLYLERGLRSARRALLNSLGSKNL